MLSDPGAGSFNLKLTSGQVWFIFSWRKGLSVNFFACEVWEIFFWYKGKAVKMSSFEVRNVVSLIGHHQNIMIHPTKQGSCPLKM